MGGCLSNFLCIRWFYFFNNIKFYRECPDILILLENRFAVSFIGEAVNLGIPVVSYASFGFMDIHVSYLLFSGNSGLGTKKNSFFFFLYLLKNMLVLEASLKKKTFKTTGPS